MQENEAFAEFITSRIDASTDVENSGKRRLEADAKEASEDTVCDAFDHLLESAKPVVKFIEDFAGSVDSTSQNSFLFNKEFSKFGHWSIWLFL